MSLRIGIVGCGDMGRKHAAAWAQAPGACLAALCDQDAQRAQDLARFYGTDAYLDWRDMLAQETLDVVSICVPCSHHHDIAVAAAERGCHVLCEKPMAMSLTQADAMIGAAEANQVQLAICHQYRSLPHYRAIKDLVASGRIGAPLYIRFMEAREVRPKLEMHRLSGNGGPVHDMCGHLFDLARFITGAEFGTISAQGAVFGRDKKRLQAVQDFGVDTAEILARMQHGHCLSIGLNWGLPEGFPGYSSAVIHGPQGLIYAIDSQEPDRFLGDPSPTLEIVVKDAKGRQHIPCPTGDNSPEACVLDLMQAIEHGHPLEFSAANGRAALAAILASLDAIHANGQGTDL